MEEASSELSEAQRGRDGAGVLNGCESSAVLLETTATTGPPAVCCLAPSRHSMTVLGASVKHMRQTSQLSKAPV